MQREIWLPRPTGGASGTATLVLMHSVGQRRPPQAKRTPTADDDRSERRRVRTVWRLCSVRSYLSLQLGTSGFVHRLDDQRLLPDFRASRDLCSAIPPRIVLAACASDVGASCGEWDRSQWNLSVSLGTSRDGNLRKHLQPARVSALDHSPDAAPSCCCLWRSMLQMAAAAAWRRRASCIFAPPAAQLFFLFFVLITASSCAAVNGGSAPAPDRPPAATRGSAGGQVFGAGFRPGGRSRGLDAIAALGRFSFFAPPPAVDGFSTGRSRRRVISAAGPQQYAPSSADGASSSSSSDESHHGHDGGGEGNKTKPCKSVFEVRLPARASRYIIYPPVAAGLRVRALPLVLQCLRRPTTSSPRQHSFITIATTASQALRPRPLVTRRRWREPHS